MASSYDRMIFGAVLGFSSSLIFLIPALKKKNQRRQIIAGRERLRIVNETLEQAEERVTKLQERHDRILHHVWSSYLSSEDLDEALAGARAAMDDALDFAGGLRKLQMKILSSLADDGVDGF